MRGATQSLESNSPHGHSLEEEQRFYIQQLFIRYGQKGRLDFKGFQNLLFNLGLAEVKVVNEDHEDLGHDHVAHLDLLEVQEGLHSHSSKEDHDHEHGHGHGHPHNKPRAQHPHKEQAPTPCSNRTTSASPAVSAAVGHDHKHDHDHDHGHDVKHDYAKGEVSDHRHDKGHVQDTHEHDDAHDHEHKHEHDLLAQPHHDVNSSDHNYNDVHEGQPGSGIDTGSREQHSFSQFEPSLSPQEPPSSPATTESLSNKQRKRPRLRGQRRRNSTTSSPSPLPDEHGSHFEHSDDDLGHHHAHKNKREAPRGPVNPILAADDMSVPAGGLSHQHEEVH